MISNFFYWSFEHGIFCLIVCFSSSREFSGYNENWLRTDIKLRLDGKFMSLHSLKKKFNYNKICMLRKWVISDYLPQNFLVCNFKKSYFHLSCNRNKTWDTGVFSWQTSWKAFTIPNILTDWKWLTELGTIC